MRDIVFSLDNDPFNLHSKFKISYNEKDIYLSPPVASGILAKSGFHISFHKSGKDHIRFKEPVSCLSHDPLVHLPFSRKEFIGDIMVKRNFKQFESRPYPIINSNKGLIGGLNIDKLLYNFLHSKNFSDVINKIYSKDYYVIRSNPYLTTSSLVEHFPNLNIKIDTELINNASYIIESDCISKDISNIKSSGYRNELIFYIQYDNPNTITLIKDFNAFVFDFNDPISLINKIPGGKVLYECLKPYFIKNSIK